MRWGPLGAAVMALCVASGVSRGGQPGDVLTALLGLDDEAAKADNSAGDTGPAGPAGNAAPGPGAGDAGWVWFSDRGRALRPLLADQREAQFRGGFMTARHGDTFGDAGVGGDIALLRCDRPEDRAESLSIRALFTARFQMNSESTNQLNTDYLAGLAYGRRYGDQAWEAYLYHQSSHLGDETLDFMHRERIDYGKEVARFLWSYDVAEGLRVYGGPAFNVSGEPFLRYKTNFQAGAEYSFGAWGQDMYLATDVQCREVNDWRPGVNTQIGMHLGDPEKVKHRPRIFAEVYTGYSNMGQFFDVYETSFLIGMGFNW